MNSSFRVGENTVFNPETGEFGYLPEILLFSTDKTILTDETPATINWTVSNATVIKLNNEIVEATGTKTFSTTDLLEIELIASNDVGEADPRKITIDIDRTPPIISNFNINEDIAIVGSPITLTWNVENAHSIVINNGVGDVTNKTSKEVISTENSGIYKLIAKNYFGITSEKETSITVFPTPLIKSLIIPTPNIEKEINLSINFPKFPAIELGINQINSSLNIDLNNKILESTQIPFVELQDDFDFINSNSGYLKKLLSKIKFKNNEVFKNIFRTS
jgi:hypothetical protein